MMFYLELKKIHQENAFGTQHLIFLSITYVFKCIVNFIPSSQQRVAQSFHRLLGRTYWQSYVL